MDGPRECSSKVSQRRRMSYDIYDIPYMWHLKRNDTNKLTKQRLTDSKNDFMVSRGKMGGRNS